MPEDNQALVLVITTATMLRQRRLPCKAALWLVTYPSPLIMQGKGSRVARLWHSHLFPLLSFLSMFMAGGSLPVSWVRNSSVPWAQ